MRTPLASVLLFLLAGCSTSSSVVPAAPGPAAPARVQLQGGLLTVQTSGGPAALSAAIPAPPERVWETLPAAYRALGLNATGADPANRILLFDDRVARIGGRRLSTFLDCGRGVAGPNADTYDVTLRLMAQVIPAGNAAEVQARVEGIARNRGTSGSSVACRSQGELERRLFEVLAELVKG